MSFLETNCLWIAVIYKVLQSVAASLLKLIMHKSTTIQIYEVFYYK